MGKLLLARLVALLLPRPMALRKPNGHVGPRPLGRLAVGPLPMHRLRQRVLAVRRDLLHRRVLATPVGVFVAVVVARVVFAAPFL